MGRRGAGARDGIDGPGDAVLHRDMAGRRVDHQLRDGEGMYAALLFGIDLPIAVVQGALSADPGADEAGGALAKPVRKADAGIRDRLARRHEGKLRKPVQHAELALLEMRSEEHTSELQSLMRISYDVFCFKKKTKLLLTTLLSST